jgi:hypothetical protein
MKFILFFLLLFFYSSLKASDVQINSIIVLENNIPKECGLNFKVLDKDKIINTMVSIKKKKGATSTYFYLESQNKKINYANILSSSINLLDLIEKKNKSNNSFEIENSTNVDKTNVFFQELLINGGKIEVEEKSYEIIGPIDSKVRLEYLFCTGEMFLPNYEANQNE